MLNDHSDGVIATTGCLGGQVLQSLLRGDEAEALDKAGRLQEIFGKDNLFVELQDHGIPEQKQTNPALMKIASKLELLCWQLTTAITPINMITSPTMHCYAFKPVH